jgi:hypothetical protein
MMRRRIGVKADLKKNDVSLRRIKSLASGAPAHHLAGVANLGQQKLKLWAGKRSIRKAAIDLGSNYRSYRRWAEEGSRPDYDGRRLCRDVAGVGIDDWELPPSASLARQLERLARADG